MNRRGAQNVLLMEIMVAVLFFALCSTVLLETFMAAREYSRRSELESKALVNVQDIAEQLYATADESALLTELGFEWQGDRWLKEQPEYTLTAEIDWQTTTAGRIRKVQICAMNGESALLELPCVRYWPGRTE